ncbi:MAG TPA: hypothetical protein DIC42_00995 [Holosporales bacterium]|nr:hypothetical protein [Holosporales bacterium]
MGDLQERLSDLKIEYLEQHNKRKEEKGEDDPRTWYWYMDDHRFFAVCSYVLDHDVQGFIDHMKQVVHYQNKMLDKRDAGEYPEDYEFVSAPAFDKIFETLCTQDLDLIKNIVKRFLNINLKKTGPLAKHCHKAFRLFILGQDGTRADLNDMEIIFAKRLKSYVGYALCFQAIYDHDKEKFLSGFATMIKGHKRLSTPQGIFGGTVDEVIAFWPLAVVNLARFKGLDVMVDYPLVPKELITKQLGGLYD